VSAATVLIGRAVKFVAVGIALVILIGVPAGMGERFLPIALFTAIPVGCLLFVLGVLISAQGQMTRASLDGAVYASPFLSDQDRLEVMRIE
jgi:hypothetical protein